MRSDVVVAIPALNCEATVGAVVEGCRRFVETVIVVDDGSTDATGRQAAKAGALVERLPENRGKGVALRRGIDLALEHDPQAVALLDADGQHDPEDLAGLLAAWDDGAGDLLIGSRMGESEVIPRPRYWTNYIGSRILSWMSGLDLQDSQSGYRLVDADLLRNLGLCSRGYAIESEMLLKAAHRSAKVVHVPIRTIYDTGPSHFRPVLDTVRISCASIYYKVFDDV